MAQLLSKKAPDKPKARLNLSDIDPRLAIAVLVVLVLALLGAGWKFFNSGPSTNPKDITMPVDG